MKSNMVLLEVIVILLCVAAQDANAKLIYDDFNDDVIDPEWNSFQNGCTITEAGGELRIQGTTVESGWGKGSGLSRYYQWISPDEDFELAVDFSVPEFSGSGTRLIYLMGNASIGGNFGLFYSYGYGYRVQTWDPSEFSTWLDPFGDEESEFHRMKLVYSSASQSLTGYVDDLLVGSLNIELRGNLNLSVSAASETAGMGIDTRFDNYEAIPEPASIGLIGLFTGGLYFARRLFLV